MNWASDRIDDLLREEPGKKGKEYYGDYIIDVAPLAAAFRLVPDDLLVYVLQVMRIKN